MKKEVKEGKEQVLLVDGSAVFHRAYHAYPKLTTRSGRLVNAVYGVGSILISSFEMIGPDYVAVAWDTGKPTFRHEEYVAYKAHRPETDEELKEQFPEVERMIEAFSIPQLMRDGYEADDVLGSLARKFANEEREVVVMTGDKDLVQLVDDERIMVYIPGRGGRESVLYREEEVMEKFGVRSDQIIDYKAMVGDSSDNIPGVKGVGPVTAGKLLSEFKGIDGIYEDLDKVNELMGSRVRGLLEKGKESAYLSRSLGRIRCDVEVEIELEEMRYEGLEKDELREFFQEMNFKSLERRVFGERKKKKDKQMGMF